jgi:hypothetical protein
MSNHASHAALPYPIKNTRFTVYVPLVDADGDPTAQTTPDTEISEDNAAATDAAEEVSATSGMDGMGMITFTGAETDCSLLAANFKAASGPKATLMTLYPRVLAEVGTGTLSAGSAGGGTLGSLLAYDVTGCFIKTTGGTGGGGAGGANNQARKIVTYNTGTGAFTVTPNWETTPSTDTTYAVLLPEGVTLGMLKAINPTTPGRTLDVAATGEAGLDFDNIKQATGATTLTNITVPIVTTLTNLPAITANWLTAAGIAAGALNGKGDWNIGKTGYALSAAGIQAIWDALTSALSTVGSIGKLLVDNINATIGSRSSHAAADITGGTTVAAAVTALTAEHDATQVTLALVKLSTDYPDDAVMLDPVNGTAGTTVGTHGTHRTPCTTFADASTIAAARGKNHIKFISGASVLVSSGTYQGYQVDLNGGNLFLNQDATFSGGSQIYSSQYGATLDPDWGGGQNTVDLDSGCFYENLIFSSSLRAIDNCYLRKCVLGYTSSAITFTILGDNGSNPVYLEDCYTAQISGLTFDCSGGADLLLQNWGGDFTITNLAAGTTVVIYGYAKVTVAASCTGGTVRHTSHVEITDSSGGAVTMDLISEAGTVSGFTTAAKAELQQEAADALTAYGASTVTTAQVNAEVLDVLNVDTLVDGKTLAAAMRYIAAGVAGRISGAGTGTEIFLGLDEATTRLTVTVDSSGNRSDITYG